MFEDGAFVMSALLNVGTRLVSCSGSFRAEKSLSYQLDSRLGQRKIIPPAVERNPTPSKSK